MIRANKQLKEVLERLYAKYNRRELIAPDPLQFVYRYESKADREIVGLLCASLAYGRVAQIGKSLERLFGIMGGSPYEFVAGFGKRNAGKLSGFKHRFNTAEDIADLLWLLKKVFKKHGSIEAYFLRGYRDADENILPALGIFCGGLEKMHGEESSGLKYLLSNPERGSACKRMNLYLRWMVRDDDVDCGVWSGVDQSKLIVPIDVHMGRLCKILGMYEQKTVSLKAAVDVTRSFAEICPEDPVRYDFCLSRIGIVENCDGHKAYRCGQCELKGYCKNRADYEKK